MKTLSIISDFLIRTNAKFWSQKNSVEARMEINYNLKKNYIEDLVLSGKFWGGVTSERYTNNDIIVYFHEGLDRVLLAPKLCVSPN